MTVLSKSTERAVYPLTPADGNPVSRVNLAFVGFYKTSSPPQPKVAECMRKSFFKAMESYPILYGRLTANPDKSVVKDKYLANLPVVLVDEETKQALKPSYKEYAVEEKVENIQSGNYHWRLWPSELLSVCPMRTSNREDPFVQCVVTWHEDGMGIMFSVDHSLADGTGMDILFNQWANKSRSMLNGGDEDGDGNLLMPADFDHLSIWEAVCNEPAKDNAFIRHVDGLEAPKEASITSKVGTFDTKDANAPGPRDIELQLRHNIRSIKITVESLARLKADMLGADTRESSGTHISAMSLAYALLWQRYMAVSASINGDAVNRPAGSPCYLSIMHSGRTLIDRPYYIGNVVCPIYVIQSLEELLNSPICKVAETVASNLHSLEKPSWQAFLLLLQDPERYAKFLSIFGNPDTMQLSFSNASRLKFFDADFGFGKPEYIVAYPMAIPGFAIWTPLTKEGGALISWNIPQNIYDELKRDELFQKYVDVMY